MNNNRKYDTSKIVFLKNKFKINYYFKQNIISLIYVYTLHTKIYTYNDNDKTMIMKII